METVHVQLAHKARELFVESQRGKTFQTPTIGGDIYRGERDEAGEEKKTVEPAALGRRPTYVERCNNLRERKQSQIIYHVEGELALFACMHG